MELPTNDGGDQQCQDPHLSSLSQHELISEISALRGRLDRRNVLLDVIRKAYHRDVVFVKERLADAESRGLAYAADGTNACISNALTSVPSIDLRKTFRLFAPQECEMRLHPCWSCGGQLEVIHRESTRIANFKYSIHLLQAKEHDLRMEVVNAKAQAREDRMRLVEVNKNSMNEKSELLEQIQSLKEEMTGMNILREELDRVLRIKEALENQLELQGPIIRDHQRLVVEIEDVKGVSMKWENQFHEKVRDNTNLSKQNECLVQNLKKIQKNNDALAKDLDDYRENCRALEEECSTLKSEISKCKAEAHETAVCLQKAEVVINESDREYEIERQRFESKIKELESECRILASRAAESEEKAFTTAKEADSYRRKIEATLGGDKSFDSDKAFVKINELIRDEEMLRQKDISSSNLIVSYIRTAYENCLAQEKILEKNGSELHTNIRLFQKTDKAKNEKSQIVFRHLDDANNSDAIDWVSFMKDDADRRHVFGNMQNRLLMGQFSLEKCFEKIHRSHRLEVRKCQDGHKKEMEEKTSRIWELEKFLTTAIGTNRDYECKMSKICEKHELMELQIASLRSTLRKLRRDYGTDRETVRHLQKSFGNLLPVIQKLLADLRIYRKRNNELTETVHEKQNEIAHRDATMKQLEKLLEKMTDKFSERERLRVKVTHEAATQAMPVMTDTATSADFLTAHNAHVTPPPSSDSKVDNFLLPGRIWNINSDEIYPSRVTVGEGLGRSSVQFRRAIDKL